MNCRSRSLGGASALGVLLMLAVSFAPPFALSAGAQACALEETCDGLDNDCDGLVDEDLPDSCRVAIGMAGDRFGNGVMVGDVNGDGFGDVLFAEPDYGEGRILLFYGSASGRFRTPDWMAEGLSDSYPSATSRFGTSIAGVGDTNLDGFDDFVVGSPGYDFGAPPGVAYSPGSRGRVDLYMGAATGPVQSWSATGTVYGQLLGRFVTGAGDVNGDGFPDWVVSSIPSGIDADLLMLPHFDVRFGCATVGACGGQTISGQRFEDFGWTVAGADVNGDGFGDVLATVLAGSFRVYLYFGSNSGLSAAPVWQVPIAGRTVRAVGDLDGDAFDDFAVVESTTSAIYRGASVLPATVPAWQVPSTTVAAAGDMELDGYDDLLIETVVSDGDTIRQGVALLRGTPAGPSETPPWTGAFDGGYCGVVAGGGDYDGDGQNDVVVGCPAFDSGTAVDAGRADLLLGRDLVCKDRDADGMCDFRYLRIAFSSPLGHDSGTVSWGTEREIDLVGFNIIVLQGSLAIRQNDVLIPCEGCVTGSGHDYTYIVPKHRSGRNLYVEVVRLDGSIVRVGPASRE